MRRGQVVPLPAPPEREIAGDVRLVGDGPVGVSLGVRALAAAVRLDPVADLARGVGRPARLLRVLDREVPPRRFAVDDPLGADHAGVADVDHVRLLDVQPDPEAGEKDGRCEKHPDRPARRPGRAAVPGADPDPAQHHPDEQRVEEGHRREDVAVVEEPQRRRRREEEKQVEVAEREKPPEVGEPDEEDETERAPDPRVVDRRAAEGARRAARHPPRDLRARPRLAHVAARVEHRPLSDLAGRDVLAAPPDLDLPLPGLRVVRRLVAQARLRVAREPGGDLRKIFEDPERLLLRERRARPARHERRLDEVPFPVVRRGP